MTSRPRAGRGTAGRDGGKDVDLEAELLAEVAEGVRKAQEHHTKAAELLQQALELEQEMADMKARGTGPTTDQVSRCSELYRQNLRESEEEQKTIRDYDLINKLAIVQAMRSENEPAARSNGPVGKGRKGQRPAAEPETPADSPGPSPNESRVDQLKRSKGNTQRSSSVASSRSAAAPKTEDVPESKLRGAASERVTQFAVGTEVAFRYTKRNAEGGIGQHGIVKKIWSDRNPVTYDVQDPEPDLNGKRNSFNVKASNMIPIPRAGSQMPTFPVETLVVARYPETDEFFSANVLGFQKGKYTLIFEGEENNETKEVDKRFVMDAGLWTAMEGV